LNIAVLIREKIDPVGNPIFSEDNKKISDLNKILSIDESDFSAMKTATKIKKQIPDTNIHVFYIGNNHYMLRSVLALGADEAQLVKFKDGQHIFDIIPFVYQIMNENTFDLFLTGQQGAGANGAGATLASMAGATLITAAILLELLKEGTGVATRTLGRGQRQIVSFKFPALVMCDRTMDIDEHSSIPNLLNGTKIKIKKHELKILNMSERIMLQNPSPRPKKIFMPDSKAGASNRLKQILSGGVKQRTMDRLEGESKEIAQQFISFLKKENVIPK
jgi:electron transfer flavoprotein beta subunit